MTSLDEFFTETLPPPDPLRDSIVEMVRRRHEATPRHQQVELGPSEVGHPCMRKMAFGIMNVPRANAEYDPLPSILGTAAHTWMESAARLDNERLGRERWLIETRVEVTPGLSGSCDLFDKDTGTVIDYKFPGYTSFTKYLKDPGPTYRHQTHLYGKGFERLGYEVNTVGIAFFPRTGTLTKMHLWREDYNPEIADAVLAKRDAVLLMLDDFKVEIDPGRYQWFPTAPYDCIWCPWWRPEPKSPIQCDGKATS
jgi:hypothetical protein